MTATLNSNIAKPRLLDLDIGLVKTPDSKVDDLIC